MRSLLILAPVLAVSLACGKPPTPEELAEQTASDVDTFWQEAFATARITNSMQVRDEFFTTIEGLQRYPSTSRPVIPDSSFSTDGIADIRTLVRRVFAQGNVTASGGTAVTFRVNGTDLCTPLRGGVSANTDCVKNVDKLKVAIKAVGGSAGVELILLLNDTLEVGTVAILKGTSVGVTADLANAKPLSEFINSTLGMDSPFRGITIDGKGKVEVKLTKHGTSDFEATISFLSDLSGTITDNNGFTRSGSAVAKTPAVTARIDGPNKTLSASVDLGASDFHGMWSDFFDYKLKTPMVWTLSGLGVKASLKDNGAKTASVSVGQGANTLSYSGQTVVSATLNPNAMDKFDAELSVGTSGLSAVTVRPGIAFALSFNLQPVANAGSMIDPAILNATYTYALSASDNAPKLELNRITAKMNATMQLLHGSLSLSSSNSSDGPPRKFEGSACVANRDFYYSSTSSMMSRLLDFWMRCEDCKPGECGGSTPQSMECKKYVTCYEATGGTVGALDSTYGTNGTCWSTTPAAANSCTDTCISAYASLKSAFPTNPSCP